MLVLRHQRRRHRAQSLVRWQAVAVVELAQHSRLSCHGRNRLADCGAPRARLLLAWPGFADPRLQERLRALAAGSGIAPDRLELRPGGAPAAFLARYGEIDIALDPRPYSGGLTTLEALWMGVPVVTCPDERFAGRHAASHLTQAGLADWIVPDEAAYVARAAAAAADLDRLSRLRQGLRAQLSASPLLDGAGFAHRLDALWRRIWRRRSAGL